MLGAGAFNNMYQKMDKSGQDLKYKFILFLCRLGKGYVVVNFYVST